MRENKILKMVLAALFLALAYVLPFLTGQIPEIGNMLLPMHIPALLCGFICGWPWGLAVGFTAPLLRSLTLGMPTLFPKAVCMSFELAAYGAMAGLLYMATKAIMRKYFPNKNKITDNVSIYIALVVAMIIGRIVWGVVMFACLGFDLSKFGMAMFWAEVYTKAVPGIIIQLVLIPPIVMLFNKFKGSLFTKN